MCQAKSCPGEITPGSCQAKSLTASAARPYKEPVTPGRQILRNLTFANQLTFLRLVSIPFLALALLSNRHGLALGLFAAAALTDAFDGLIARILKQKTALGALLDPAADKMLLTCSLVLLSLPDHMRIAPDFTLANRLPLWLIVLTISRDLFIVLTAAVLYLAYGIARFPPTLLGKLTTGSEVLLVTLVLGYNSRAEESNLIVPMAVWATLVFTLASGFHYIYRTGVLIRQAQPESMVAMAGGGPEEAPSGRTSDLRAVAATGRGRGSAPQ